jgi:AraC-like DNA-binding protein
VSNLGLFGEGIRQFWMDDLKGLLGNHPHLEHPHQQDFYTLLFIEKAEGELIIDDKKIRLDDPKTIIIKPNCIYSIDINRNAKGKIICFSEDFFSLRYNNNILYQFSFLKREAKPYIRFNDVQQQKWQVLSNLMFEEFSLNRKESNKVLRSFLNILMFELERLYKPIGYKQEMNVKTEKVLQFERYVDEFYLKYKMPSAYAEKLNLSPNYLNKLCKEETGLTAGEIIRKRITIEAQRLLHYTSLSVNEIANKLGFENTSYFVTFFKKQTELTPEQFRKNT